MILLLAPLAGVADDESLRDGRPRGPPGDDRRRRAPGLPGDPPGQAGRDWASCAAADVAGEPTVTLLDAMRLAAGRDLVARQYANGYLEVFRTRSPRSGGRSAAGRPLETAIVASATSTLLARHPDTLIARKRGAAEAHEASRRAAEVLAARLARHRAAGLAPGRFRPLAAGRGPRPQPRHDGRPRDRRLVRRPAGWDNPLADARRPLGWSGPVAVGIPSSDRGLVAPRRSVPRARSALQGPRHTRTSSSSARATSSPSRAAMRADPRPQLSDGRRGGGRPGREPLRLRLHRPAGPDPRHHRRARPPDAPADPERHDPARGGRPELAGPIPRSFLELPQGRVRPAARSPTPPPSSWPTTSPDGSARNSPREASRCPGCSGSRSRRASASRPRWSGSAPTKKSPSPSFISRGIPPRGPRPSAGPKA